MLTLIRYALIFSALLDFFWKRGFESSTVALVIAFAIILLLQLKWYFIESRLGHGLLLAASVVAYFLLITQSQVTSLFFGILILVEFVPTFNHRWTILLSVAFILCQLAVTIYLAVPLNITEQLMIMLCVPMILYGSRISKERQLLKDEKFIWTSERNALSRDSRQMETHLGSMKELYILKERNRISREIHDSVGHVLSTVVVQLAAISKLTESSSPQASQMSLQLRDFASKGLQTVRQVVSDLRPDNYEERHFLVAMDELIQESQSKTGVKIIFHSNENQWQLSERQALLIYRAVQEFVSNSVRHGQATEIRIVMHFNPSEVIMTLIDNGIGSDKVVPHIGLMGIEERTLELNGEVTYRTAKGEGFQMRIVLYKGVDL